MKFRKFWAVGGSAPQIRHCYSMVSFNLQRTKINLKLLAHVYHQ